VDVKTVNVRLVILNLADVAMFGSVLPAMEVSDKPGHGVTTAVLDIIRGSRIENNTSARLVGVYDRMGEVDVVYRVRTRSMALNSAMRWVNVDVALNGNCAAPHYIMDALDTERV
jgi:hypothetical protein